MKLSLLRTEHFSSTANVLTSSPKIWHVNKRNFFQLNWLGSDQWIWWRWCDAGFNSCRAGLPCCLPKGPLKWDFLAIYLTTFSESVISDIQNLWGSSFCSKCLKFNLDFENVAKIWEKDFSFWYNWNWIGILKWSIWRTRYFSSAADVLTRSPKIWHVNKRDFFEFSWLGSDQWIWYSWFDEDLNSACARLPCCLSKCSLKWDFVGIYLTTFSQSVICAIQKLWRSTFFKKRSKF